MLLPPSEQCPACHGHAPKTTLDRPLSGLGESIFNIKAAFHACSQCGMVYVANLDDATLARFYTGECAYFSSNHFDIHSPENMEKYKVYRDLLVASGLKDKDILDVGCGRGGFLHWLKQDQWHGFCRGVDADPRSISEEKIAGDGVELVRGDAFHLPVSDRSQEVLTYFHVLEHLRNLDQALVEAARVLKGDGHLLIEVPDAERYVELPIGTNFWFGIREHVNHFSPAALEKLLHRHGLSTLHIYRNVLPTPEFSYPSLLLVAQKSASENQLPITGSSSIADFLHRSQLAQAAQAVQVSQVMASHTRNIFWGCSAQLFSLLPLLDLSRTTLCDASSLKQDSHYRGMSIHAPAEIQPGDAALFIAPYLHRSAIRRAALSLGWSDSDIYILE